MRNFIKELLDRQVTTFDKGKLNEVLVCGNLYKRGLKVKWLNDNNPNYDIVISNDKVTVGVECKLDLLSLNTGNFYLEYYNYTFNRYTGILNNDMKSLFSYTYIEDGQYYALIGFRYLFKEAVKVVWKHYKNYLQIRCRYSKKTGRKLDGYFLINKEVFLKCFLGKKIRLKQVFTTQST